MSTLETGRLKLRTWTRTDYHRAAELGIFGPSERLELLDGEIVEKMSPQSNPHAAAVSLAGEALRKILATGCHVREEKPILLSELSEPEPDIVVVRGSLRQSPRHPTPETALLVMDVSETVIALDRTVKAALYARHGIREYWILNLRQRQLEIHREPGLLGDGAFGYRQLNLVMADGEASTLAAPDHPVRVADMLPSEMPGA